MFCDGMAGNGDPAACDEETAKTLALDAVLSSLYDFGEAFDAPKKKAVKRKSSTSGREPKPDTAGSVEVSDDTAVYLSLEVPSKRSVYGFFETLKDELQHGTVNLKGLTPAKEEDSTSSATQQGQGLPVKVVKFLSRSEKKVKGEASQEKVSKLVPNIQEEEEEMIGRVFNFEKARLEVHKFGITGYKKERQRTFEQERAIMLGAKPPKKEYLNYKIYQDKIKQRNAEKQETSGKEFQSESVKKKKRRRKRGPEERRTKKEKIIS